MTPQMTLHTREAATQSKDSIFTALLQQTQEVGNHLTRLSFDYLLDTEYSTLHSVDFSVEENKYSSVFFTAGSAVDIFF